MQVHNLWHTDRNECAMKEENSNSFSMSTLNFCIFLYFPLLNWISALSSNILNCFVAALKFVRRCLVELILHMLNL